MDNTIDISSISNLYSNAGLGSSTSQAIDETDNTSAFGSLLQSAMSMYSQADSLQKSAEQAEIDFALGNSDNTHDLAIAQQKANIAIQFTAKVTNKFLEAYKEIMNIQL